MEMINRKKTEEAWEEGKAARNLKNAFERRTNRNSQYSQQGTKRQGSPNSSPPLLKKAQTSGTPSDRAPTSFQAPPRNPPTQSAGALPPGHLMPAPHPPSSSEAAAAQPQHAAAAVQPPANTGAVPRQPGAGYFHQQYHNGVPVSGYGHPYYYGQQQEAGSSTFKM